MQDAPRADGAGPDREQFGRHVRDALVYLYDLPYLGRHPLAGILLTDEQGDVQGRGRFVQQLLMQAIEALKPEGETPSAARALRRYDLMRLRYVEGVEIAEVCKALGVSLSGYYREHRVGLDTVTASLLVRDAGAGATDAPREDAQTEPAGQPPLWDQAFQALGSLVLDAAPGERPERPPAWQRLPRVGDYAKARDRLWETIRRLGET